MKMLVRAWDWDLRETDWKYVLYHYKEEGEGEGSDWAELMGSDFSRNRDIIGVRKAGFLWGGVSKFICFFPRVYFSEVQCQLLSHLLHRLLYLPPLLLPPPPAPWPSSATSASSSSSSSSSQRSWRRRRRPSSSSRRRRSSEKGEIDIELDMFFVNNLTRYMRKLKDEFATVRSMLTLTRTIAHWKKRNKVQR